MPPPAQARPAPDHTGLYTFQSGQVDNVGDWPMDLPTFTQALQDMGYHTALTGNIHAHQAVGYDIDLTGAEWDGEIRALGLDDVVQTSGKTMAFFTDDAYTHYLRTGAALCVSRGYCGARQSRAAGTVERAGPLPRHRNGIPHP